MIAEETNLLFTSAGRRVELLRAFRKAYADLGIAGRIIAVDMDPLAPALHEADASFILPPLSDPSYASALIDICRREPVALVVPLIDPDIAVLASLAEQVEAVGARPLVLSRESVAVTADKWLTHGFFEEVGVPVPRTWLPTSVPQAVDFPAFVKPRFGSAGKRAFQVRSRSELNFFLQYVPDPVVQEFMPGPEITCDVFCDFDGNVLTVVCRQRIEVRSGEVAKGKTIHNPEIIDGCVKVAKGLEAVGPITVQCIMRDHRPFFTEVNPRFGGGVPLAIAAGVPLAHWLLSLVAGRRIETPPLGSYEQDLYLTRFDDSFIIKGADIGRAAGRRL